MGLVTLQGRPCAASYVPSGRAVCYRRCFYLEPKHEKTRVVQGYGWRCDYLDDYDAHCCVQHAWRLGGAYELLVSLFLMDFSVFTGYMNNDN